MTKVLRIDASMRHDGSMTRALTDQVIEKLGARSVTVRDLAKTGPNFVDGAWIGANFTDSDARDQAQKDQLAQSEMLIAEIRDADVLVIGVPIYNFGVPAALKAWIDQICRARETFRYTDNGPEGLLQGKRAILVTASGGVPVDSPVDFATPYMRHVMNFIGIQDVQVVAADRLMADADAAQARAAQAIAGLAA
ncbi:MAG: NAD(P)H-dependent oxidoreductase [Pseudomonadota bacterium]